MIKYKALKNSGIWDFICIIKACILFFMSHSLSYESSLSYGIVLVIWLFKILLVLMGVIAIADAVWQILFDPLCGRYAFDTTGISFFTIKKQFYYPWSAFMDVGTSQWVDRMYKKKLIYFSSKTIPTKYKDSLANRRRKKGTKENLPIYTEDYVLIEYDAQAFQALIDVVPKWMRDKLLEEV